MHMMPLHAGKTQELGGLCYFMFRQLNDLGGTNRIIFPGKCHAKKERLIFCGKLSWALPPFSSDFFKDLSFTLRIWRMQPQEPPKK